MKFKHVLLALAIAICVILTSIRFYAGKNAELAQARIDLVIMAHNIIHCMDESYNIHID